MPAVTIETTPVAHRGAITATIICACVMQGLDTTIVSRPSAAYSRQHVGGQDQISWVLTSYIVASATTMPFRDGLPGHFGVKYIFLGSVIGFTIASALCGAATSLTQLVLYRLLQGVCSAGLVPLGQATLFTIYPREKHGHAMAIFSTGAMIGSDHRPDPRRLAYRKPRLALVLLYQPAGRGAVRARGLCFIRQTRTMRRSEFDMFGFLMLSIAVGSLQLMLDRGQLKDWFHSTEIWIEATIAALCFYLLVVHRLLPTSALFSTVIY